MWWETYTQQLQLVWLSNGYTVPQYIPTESVKRKQSFGWNATTDNQMVFFNFLCAISRMIGRTITVKFTHKLYEILCPSFIWHPQTHTIGFGSKTNTRKIYGMTIKPFFWPFIFFRHVLYMLACVSKKHSVNDFIVTILNSSFVACNGSITKGYMMCYAT